uniref:Ankyrin 3 n=1 Tax=Nothobranchius furzeri TaxID=105023 RepID=A0A8C6Q2T6_NOTFU
MTGDTDKYLRPQDFKELGDDSLPQEGYQGFSLGVRSASLRSFSSDRSNTLNRSSFARDSMMIEEILAPTKDTHLAVTRDYSSECMRRYSWTPDTMDNSHTVSSPIHSGFLVSFMVDARGGSMRGSRHNGMRIIIPPRKCTAPTRITCRLVKRHKVAYPPPMVEGEGLVSRLVEVGPAGAQFLGPVIVEIPHFGSMRGKERELIVLRSDNGDVWKEHQCDTRPEDPTELLAGMDEEMDSPEELEKKRICRIVTRDFPQYFAVVSRIKQESNHIGPDGGILTCNNVPMVQASFPQGALTKRIRVGLQAQPVPDDMARAVLGNRATFSPIVTVEPRRRKFHKPITMTIPVPPRSAEGHPSGLRGDAAPCLRLLCSITGGTSPAQWEDITGTTPLSFVTDCVSFTTNVSARFWLADCHQIPETVSLASQLYRELICVPYLAKFVVFAKMNDVIEARLRCFCMTDDKVDKTLEQQENFEEVARSKDIEVLEGKPIFVDCYGNLSPLTKTGQQLIFNFYSFKENRLPFDVKIRDMGQEPCGRLSFLREPKTFKGLPQTAVCNLNITLPTHKKTEKPERRHTFASLALRKRYSYLTDPAASPQSPCERTDLRMAIVADHLGLSWTGKNKLPLSLTASCQTVLLERELIKKVERKCEMVTKDRSSMADGNILLVEQKWSVDQETDETNEQHDLIQDGRQGEGFEMERIGDGENVSKENCLTEAEHEVEKGAVEAESIKKGIDPASEIQKVDEDCEDIILEKDRANDTRGDDNLAPEDQTVSDLSPQAWAEALQQRQPSESGSTEEEVEERSSKIQEETFGSLLEETKEEGSEEEEEITKARDHGEPDRVDKNMRSLSGWHSDSSSVNVEPPTPGRSVSLPCGDGGGFLTFICFFILIRTFIVNWSWADHEHLQGEEAKNVPGESMTEEHYMDQDGNLVSRKVIRKVIRRVSTPTPENQGDDRWRRDLQHCPLLQEYESEVGMQTPFTVLLQARFNPCGNLFPSTGRE